MGCEDLYDIVDAHECYLSDFFGDTIAIDSTFWFDRYYHKVVKDSFSEETLAVGNQYYISQTVSLLTSIPHLISNDITPVFFFDPMRRNPYPKSGAEIPYLERSPTSEASKQFPFLQRSTELVLNYLDITYYESPMYAEADASKYVQTGKADVVASDDYDTLLYGAPETMRKKPYSNRWERIKLDETMRQNDIDYRELLDVAILTGTDENIGPYKNHITEALEKVRGANELDELEEAENCNLRAPSGKITDDAPSFTELHEIFRNPPLSYKLQNDDFDDVDPSLSDPNLALLTRYLDQMLKLDEEVIDDLITPISQEL